jgi:hypothetical protein
MTPNLKNSSADLFNEITMFVYVSAKKKKKKSANEIKEEE